MKLVKNNNVWLPTIFDDLFPENRMDSLNYERFSIPAVNIRDNFANFVIELAVPGLKKENIAIEIEKNVLKVSSNVSTSKESTDDNDTFKFTRKEFNFAKFERSFTLPEKVNNDAISANTSFLCL